jgi:hypothetical protein
MFLGDACPVGAGLPAIRMNAAFPSFPSSGLGTASWESKLELLHSCVPKLELGNKVESVGKKCDQAVAYN